MIWIELKRHRKKPWHIHSYNNMKRNLKGMWGIEERNCQVDKNREFALQGVLWEDLKCTCLMRLLVHWILRVKKKFKKPLRKLVNRQLLLPLLIELVLLKIVMKYLFLMMEKFWKMEIFSNWCNLMEYLQIWPKINWIFLKYFKLVFSKGVNFYLKDFLIIIL